MNPINPTLRITQTDTADDTVQTTPPIAQRMHFADTYAAQAIRCVAAGAATAVMPTPITAGATAAAVNFVGNMLVYKVADRATDLMLFQAETAIRSGWPKCNCPCPWTPKPSPAAKAASRGVATRQDIERMVQAAIKGNDAHYILVSLHRIDQSLWAKLQADGYQLKVVYVGEDLGAHIDWSPHVNFDAVDLATSKLAARKKAD